MALSEGYRSALASIGPQGGGLAGALSSGLSAGAQYAASALETAAERRRKKQEEEKAREREGLMFSLNQAIESGDEETIKALGPRVYGGVDFGAVASAAKRKKDETDRAAARTRASELLAYLPYADAATGAELSKEVGRLTAQGLGLSETIQRPTGEYDITPAMPGYGAGQELTAEQAKAVEARGLGTALEPGMTGPDMRRVVQAVPSVAEVKTPKMETVPRFSGFGEKRTKIDVKDKINLVAALIATAQKEWDSLGSAAHDALKDQYTRYKTELTAVRNALFRGEDVELPEPKSFTGVTRTDVKEKADADVRAARQRLLRANTALAEARAKFLPQTVGAQVTRAAAAVRSAKASESRAATAAKSLIASTENRANRDALTMWVQDQTNGRKLTDIDERGRKAGEAEAERQFPKKERQLLPANEQPAWDAARERVANTVAEAVVAKQTDILLKSVPRRPSLNVTVERRPQTNSRQTSSPVSAPPQPQPKPQARPKGNSLADRPGARP